MCSLRGVIFSLSSFLRTVYIYILTLFDMSMSCCLLPDIDLAYLATIVVPLHELSTIWQGAHALPISYNN